MRDTKNNIHMVAFDCGNSSIRVVSSIFDGDKFITEVIHQEANQMIKVKDLYYWDVENIYTELLKGLQKAYRLNGDIHSIGICTWGVDFGLIDSRGHLMENPLSYRNTIGQDSLNEMSEEDLEFMFFHSGIQNNRINSFYQLIGMKKNFPQTVESANSILMMPDLLAYMFTGIKHTEYSIASTAQWLDVKKSVYSQEILDKWGLKNIHFPPIVEHGSMIGTIKSSITDACSINENIPVICVPSHDTAAAVVSVPAEDEKFLFISSGTWSLIGTELSQPIISKKVYELDFANEGGAFKTITLLKNSAGMHIIQNIKKKWSAAGKNILGMKLFKWENQ
jgi:rhamnulokinase